jgi:hypothetical protein
MKKVLFSGILSILLVSASFAQVNIGITGGLNLSNMNDNGEYANEKSVKPGFQAGLIANFGINDNFSITPELLFSQRGYKYKAYSFLEDKTQTKSASLTVNYFQLPVNATYKFDLGSSSKLFVFAGPYVGYGLCGRMKVGHEKAKISFGSKDEDMKRFDFGLNAGIGYQYENLFLKFQYDPGLFNLSNDKDFKIKNTNFSITAGYYF